MRFRTAPVFATTSALTSTLVKRLSIELPLGFRANLTYPVGALSGEILQYESEEEVPPPDPRYVRCVNPGTLLYEDHLRRETPLPLREILASLHFSIRRPASLVSP